MLAHGAGSVEWSMRSMVESESIEEPTQILQRLKGAESWPEASC
jgi:hypothetical protein